jgi:hypothetical protein
VGGNRSNERSFEDATQHNANIINKSPSVKSHSSTKDVERIEVGVVLAWSLLPLLALTSLVEASAIVIGSLIWWRIGHVIVQSIIGDIQISIIASSRVIHLVRVGLLEGLLLEPLLLVGLLIGWLCVPWRLVGLLVLLLRVGVVLRLLGKGLAVVSLLALSWLELKVLLYLHGFSFGGSCLRDAVYLGVVLIELVELYRVGSVFVDQLKSASYLLIRDIHVVLRDLLD